MGNVRSLFAGLGLVLIAILAGPFGGGRETARADDNPFAPVSVTLQGHFPAGLEVAAAGGASAATVFTPDGRELVTDTTAVPYRLGAVLVFYDQANVAFYECSGIVLNYNVVLTAAHCLYHDFGYVTAADVGPGANAAGRPFGVATARRVVVPRGYATNRAAEYDFGLVMFDGAPFADALAPYPAIVTAPDSFFDQPGTVLSSFGYPGDKPALTMWKGTGPLQNYDANALITTLDAYPGQSGSPIFATNAAANGPQFVGLLTAEADTYNRALRFTERNVSALKGFCIADANQCTFDTYSTPPPYSLATHVVCRTSARCTAGPEALQRGAPIRFAFSFSPLAARQVRLEAWVNGALLSEVKWPAGPFAPGQVFDGGSGLLFPKATGQVALRVFVGEEYIGSITGFLPADLAGAPTPSPRPFVVRQAALARD